MGLRKRYEAVTTPTEGVERASRADRLKRGVWLGVSTLGASIVAIGLLWAYISVRGPIDTSAEGTAVFVGWLAIYGYADIKLFVWGVDRFDLVPPWQFRASGGNR